MAVTCRRWERRPVASRRSRGAIGAAASVAVAACLLAGAAVLRAEVKATFLYSLSSLAGRLAYDGVRIRVDQERGETYVLYQNVVRIFNPSGMEVFSFGDGLDLGQILDMAVDRRGDIILLSFKDSRTIVTRCSFRGVPTGPVEIKALPDQLAFRPNRMIHRDGLFYFVSPSTMTVIVTAESGEYRKHVDLRAVLDPEDRRKTDAEMIGFTVDRDGSMLFTLPALFKVYRYSPDGTATFFGKSGSAPGRFGILAGIASDSQGNLFVADRLKCVIMVFDREFNFLAEFGYRGDRPENLIQPDDVAIDRNDRLYVSQWRRRGISVFAVTKN